MLLLVCYEMFPNSSETENIKVLAFNSRKEKKKKKLSWVFNSLVIIVLSSNILK